MACNRIKVLVLCLSTLTVFILSAVLYSCAGLKNNEKVFPVFRSGEITLANDIYGSFYYYIPSEADSETRILVLVHGTPKDLSPIDNACFYIKCWLEFARENNYILLSPSFNQEDFSSRYGDHALSGYRGLFGRQIGADEWVLRLVEPLRQSTAAGNERISLYGHSAGGQYVARFIMMHPEIVESAVITSAATYPQPDPSLDWPYGMGALLTEIVWDDGTVNHVDVVPEKEKWLRASRIPLSVIVGLNDTGELPEELIPGQKGNNRCAIADNWIKDIHTFAENHGSKSKFKIELIPGIGHSMTGLLQYSGQAILDSR